MFNLPTMFSKKRLAWCILYTLQGWIPATTPVKKRRVLKAMLLPIAGINSIFLILNRKVILPRVELVVTTKCNLKCKDCANLIPCYTSPEHVPLTELRREIDALAQSIDGIGELKIMGGEPLLHPELESIVTMISECPIVKSIVLTTNGAVIPNDAVIAILKKNHVQISISGYELTKKKAQMLMAKLKENGVYYELYEDMQWNDHGRLDKRNRSKSQLAEVFSNCSPVCLTYVQGQLHMCPRSGNGLHSGALSIPEHDYIDLKSIGNIKAIKEKAWDFVDLPYVTACDHCDAGCRPAKKIPSALQVNE